VEGQRAHLQCPRRAGPGAHLCPAGAGRPPPSEGARAGRRGRCSGARPRSRALGTWNERIPAA